MSRHPIAIDISDEEIHVTQLGETKEGLYIRGFSSIAIDNSSPWENETGLLVAEFFRRVLKDSRFSGRKAVIHLPPRCISSFPLNFQVKANETIEQIIIGESRNYISFPLEDTVIDYPSLLSFHSGDQKKYRAIVVTTLKSIVETYFNVLKKSGFHILAVDYDVNSLIRLHTHLSGNPEHPVILCNIDKTETIICAVSGIGILAERHIPWGMKYIIDRLRNDLEISRDRNKTERLLIDYGLSYEREINGSDPVKRDSGDIERSMRKTIYQIITPYLEELIDEIHKVTAYLRSDITNAVIKEVYLYGLAGSVMDMDFFIERQLNIPVRIANPLSELKVPDNAGDLSPTDNIALALGLALRGQTCP